MDQKWVASGPECGLGIGLVGLLSYKYDYNDNDNDNNTIAVKIYFGSVYKSLFLSLLRYYTCTSSHVGLSNDSLTFTLYADMSTSTSSPSLFPVRDSGLRSLTVSFHAVILIISDFVSVTRIKTYHNLVVCFNYVLISIYTIQA